MLVLISGMTENTVLMILRHERRFMTFRQAMRDGLVAAGVVRGIRWLSGCRGAILMLHRVCRNKVPGWLADPGLWVTLDQLGRTVDRLTAEGYTLVTLDQALAQLQQGRQADPFVCLTFDDGYLDNYQWLFPWIQQREIPIAIYLTTGFLDRSQPAWWCGIETLLRSGRMVRASDTERSLFYQKMCRDLRQLTRAERTDRLQEIATRHDWDFFAESSHPIITWDMAREMAASGWVTLGIHTHSHAALSRLTPEELVEELRVSHQRFREELGRKARHFAFPYGDTASYNRHALAQVAGWGYDSAVLAHGGGLHPDGENPYALPRVGFGGSDRDIDLLIRLSGWRLLIKALPL
ncbi:NodB homology domain-containing protein [Gammaproteobacteria bacterium]